MNRERVVVCGRNRWMHHFAPAISIASMLGCTVQTLDGAPEDDLDQTVGATEAGGPNGWLYTLPVSGIEEVTRLALGTGGEIYLTGNVSRPADFGDHFIPAGEPGKPFVGQLSSNGRRMRWATAPQRNIETRINLQLPRSLVIDGDGNLVVGISTRNYAEAPLPENEWGGVPIRSLRGVSNLILAKLSVTGDVLGIATSQDGADGPSLVADGDVLYFARTMFEGSRFGGESFDSGQAVALSRLDGELRPQWTVAGTTGSYTSVRDVALSGSRIAVAGWGSATDLAFPGDPPVVGEEQTQPYSQGLVVRFRDLADGGEAVRRINTADWMERVAGAPDGTLVVIESGDSAHVVKYVGGRSQWRVRRGAGSGDDLYDAVAITSNGDIIVVGSTRYGSGGSLKFDAFVMRLSPGGRLKGRVSARGGSIHPTDIALTNDGFALVSGSFRGTAAFGAHEVVANSDGYDMFVWKVALP